MSVHRTSLNSIIVTSRYIHASCLAAGSGSRRLPHSQMGGKVLNKPDSEGGKVSKNLTLKGGKVSKKSSGRGRYVSKPDRLSRVKMNALRAPLTALPVPMWICRLFLLDGADALIDGQLCRLVFTYPLVNNGGFHHLGWIWNEKRPLRNVTRAGAPITSKGRVAV